MIKNCEQRQIKTYTFRACLSSVFCTNIGIYSQCISLPARDYNVLSVGYTPSRVFNGIWMDWWNLLTRNWGPDGLTVLWEPPFRKAAGFWETWFVKTIWRSNRPDFNKPARGVCRHRANDLQSKVDRQLDSTDPEAAYLPTYLLYLESHRLHIRYQFGFLSYSSLIRGVNSTASEKVVPIQSPSGIRWRSNQLDFTRKNRLGVYLSTTSQRITNPKKKPAHVLVPSIKRSLIPHRHHLLMVR